MPTVTDVIPASQQVLNQASSVVDATGFPARAQAILTTPEDVTVTTLGYPATQGHASLQTSGFTDNYEPVAEQWLYRINPADYVPGGATVDTVSLDGIWSVSVGVDSTEPFGAVVHQIDAGSYSLDSGLPEARWYTPAELAAGTLIDSLAAAAPDDVNSADFNWTVVPDTNGLVLLVLSVDQAAAGLSWHVAGTTGDTFVQATKAGFSGAVAIGLTVTYDEEPGSTVAELWPLHQRQRTVRGLQQRQRHDW